jgi:hypothetical protein
VISIDSEGCSPFNIFPHARSKSEDVKSVLSYQSGVITDMLTANKFSELRANAAGLPKKPGRLQ